MILPFGKLEINPDTNSDGCEEAAWLKRTRAQETSAWQARFERAGCEVERVTTRGGEERLSVLVPGPETALFSAPGAEGETETSLLTARVQRWFWDRMIVTVSETGTARFRLVYFTQAQLLLHLVVTAFFVFQVWFGGGAVPLEPSRFAVMFAAGQAAPLLISLGGFRWALASALERARA